MRRQYLHLASAAGTRAQVFYANPKSTSLKTDTSARASFVGVTAVLFTRFIRQAGDDGYAPVAQITRRHPASERGAAASERREDE